MFCAVGLASAESRAATFGAAFMDINPDRGEVGFYQIFAVSTNVSTVTIQVVNTVQVYFVSLFVLKDNCCTERYINMPTGTP